MDRYVEHALRLRAIVTPHYNCAQSVLLPFAEEAGLSEAAAMKIAANYGGGMKMSSVCGTICGALMVFGLFGVDDPQTIARFYAWFRSEHDGDMNCGDLLRNYYEKNSTNDKKPFCDGMVAAAVLKVEEILQEKGLLGS